ncbi:hypothetical protein GCM10027515_14030 [Schumannella luteola]|uniref:Uncharacterized protein n=1 Tax=Schumannella luteola TaxID=472059 RepID=A0A852YJA4_9MICO|nr:hypothetical protein [Schumannella luteola]NYG97849.1 hypothetical protein [Schumannella luteola]TPW91233.1 hypothetical protein FJ656_36055 [Schumannella luteola]
MDVTSPDDRSKASTTGVRGNHVAHRTTSTASTTSTTSSTAESDSGALVEHHAAVRDGSAHDTVTIDTMAFDSALTDADLAFLAGAEIGAAVAHGARRASTATATLDSALDHAVDVVPLPPAPPVPPLRYGHLVWSILVAALVWCFAYIHAFEPGCVPDALGCTAGPAPSLLDVPGVAMVVAGIIGAGTIGLAPWTRNRGLRAVVAVSLGALMIGGGLLALSQLGLLG